MASGRTAHGAAGRHVHAERGPRLRRQQQQAGGEWRRRAHAGCGGRTERRRRTAPAHGPHASARFRGARVQHGLNTRRRAPHGPLRRQRARGEHAQRARGSGRDSCGHRRARYACGPQRARIRRCCSRRHRPAEARRKARAAAVASPPHMCGPRMRAPPTAAGDSRCAQPRACARTSSVRPPSSAAAAAGRRGAESAV
jgi:hypothetical protein